MPNVNSPSEDEILERMLQEAGALASKMRSPRSSHNPIDGIEKSNALNNRKHLEKEKRQEAGEQGKIPPENEMKLEESDASARWMRSKPSASSSGIPTEKGDDNNAPSSVYVLHQNNANDDVSSVGSSSFRVSFFSSPTKGPLSLANAERPCSSHGQQSEEQNELFRVALHSEPQMSFQPAPDKTPAVENVPTPPKQNIGSNKLQTAIPDFTATSPNAKWEKVASAKAGDDDYVPLVDYSPEKRSNINERGSVSPTKESRLETYKGQMRQKRKRRRRATIAVCILAMGILFFFLIRRGQESFHNIKPLEPDSDSGEVCADRKGQVDMVGCHIEHGNGEETLLQHEAAFDETHFETRDEFVADEESRILDREECEECETPRDNTLDLKDGVESSDSDLATDSPLESTMGGNPTLDTPNNVNITSRSEEQIIDDQELPRSCKNLFARIFGKKCRIDARRRKKERRRIV